jgi:beta-galactosidase
MTKLLRVWYVAVAWVVLCAAAISVRAQTRNQSPDFFPISVWYGGGKARTPMLESNPRAKKEVWRRDLKQIRALGFNTVRAWMDWASGEPAPGEYQLDTLDVLLELAEEEGLRLVLQVYMDSAPAWVGRQYPDSLFVSSNGVAIKPESSPGYCLDHPGVRQADAAYYRALASRARRSKAFAGWDLWSEPHVINWANPTYIERPEFCFCPHTLSKFRSWLRGKHGTIEALNEAWYRRFRNWDEVEPGRMSTILSYTDYIDWKQFIADKLGQDLRHRYEAVKSVAPDAVATSHAAGVGLFSSPHWWEGQSDDWTMAAQVDYYGTSFYPKHSAFVDRDVPWRAALLEFARSFGYHGRGRGFWVGELQGEFGTIALNVSPTVTSEDLRIWTYSALARGAKGIHYYAWYPMSSGYESGGFGLIHLDGTITSRAREAGRIASVVNRHQQLLLSARPGVAEVAVIYNPLAHFVGGRQRATSYGGPQGEVAGIERDSLLGIHRALFPANVSLDYVHLAHATPENLRPYKLVYLPYPVMLPARAAAVLEAYVKSGGTLVTEARPGWNNERGYASDTIPGMGMAAWMGCREVAIQTVAQGKAALRWDSTEVPGLAPGTVLPGRWYEESLEPTSESARVVARFEDGAGAAVISTWGKGRTLVVGSFLSGAYEARRDPELARFFNGMLDWAKVSRPISVSGDPMEGRSLTTMDGHLLYVFNHAATEAVFELSYRAGAGPFRAVDLNTGQPVALTSEGDTVRSKLRVGASQVAAIHLTRQ